MGFNNVLAGIAVRDLETAKQWYSLLLDRQPDRVPMPNDAEWDIGGSTLQVFIDEQRAGSSSITLAPDDLITEVDRLLAAGIEPDERSSGAFDVAIYKDPEGNQIVLAQAAV